MYAKLVQCFAYILTIVQIIKKRQPRQLKKKRIRSGDTEVEDIAEEDRLTSFVDMVFGGQLASILVCEKCKKISCTYEDFNDLSLSIKAEDYARERKRDRLRSLAKKFRVRGLDFSAASNPQPRSSSVPASPTRRDAEVEQSFQQILGDADQRRRSLDATDEAATLVNEHERLSEKPMHVGGTETPALDSDASMPKGKGKQRAKDGKDEDEDGWVKLSRRISVGMGLKRGRRKGKSAEPSRERPVPEVEDEQVQEEQMNSVSDLELLKSPDPSFTIASPPLPPLPIFKSPFLRRPTPSRANSSSRNVSASPSPAASPALKPVDSEHHSHRPSSPFSRSKSPRPPKPSKEESAYLRRLLADVPASSSGAATPFHAFDSGAAARHTGLMWPKFGGAQSVEECLRMFTSVEVLDGENRVGCRRCWKIQHGEYIPRGRSNNRASTFSNAVDKDLDEDNSSEDSSISSLSADERDNVNGRAISEGDRPKSPSSLSDSKNASSSAASPSSSTSLNASSVDLSETNKDAPSEPATATVVPSPETETKFDPNDSITKTLPLSPPPPCPVMSVPSISMTRPESPPPSELSDLSSPQIRHSLAEEPRYPPGIDPRPDVHPSPSFDSLKLPVARHMRNPAAHGSNGDNTSTSSDESDDELETETSITASVHSEISVVKTSTAPEMTALALSKRIAQPSQGAPRKPPRKKEVVFRRAYKRYLIKSPPPVLVIHLKRFHQVGKSPLQLQFSSNFKKLDDAVSFPEYLDLSPFLLPKKEDYDIPKTNHGLGLIGITEKEEKSEKSETDSERCMYRLYAVVEHIGNMVCLCLPAWLTLLI